MCSLSQCPCAYIYIPLISNNKHELVVFPAAINECDPNNPTHECEQICIDKETFYMCACEDGYRLMDDGKACVGRWRWFAPKTQERDDKHVNKSMLCEQSCSQYIVMTSRVHSLLIKCREFSHGTPSGMLLSP